MDPEELKAAVGPAVKTFGEEGKKKGLASTLPVALGRLQQSGDIRRVPASGRLDQQRYRYALWKPNPLAKVKMSAEEGYVELARRYFQWAAPARPTDFQWFSGLGVKAAKAAIEPLGLVAVEPGSELLIDRQDLDAFARMKAPGKPEYALVASIDSISLLRRDLPSLVDPADMKRVVAGERGAAKSADWRTCRATRSWTAAGWSASGNSRPPRSGLRGGRSARTRRPRRWWQLSNGWRRSSPAISATRAPSASTVRRAARRGSQRSERRPGSAAGLNPLPGGRSPPATNNQVPSPESRAPSGRCRLTAAAGRRDTSCPEGPLMRVVSFTLNGKPTRLTVDEDRMLLWVLRDDLGLTGTKFGCGEALCGACTVLVDDEAVRSCATPVKDVAGKQVVTIEGLAHGRPAAPAPGGLRGAPRVPVRLLHAGHDPRRLRAAAEEPEADARRRSSRTWTTTSAAAARTSASCRPSRRRGRDEGRCAMTRHDDRHGTADGWGFVTTVDRREFLKLTSTGLLVVFAVDPLLGRQEPARAADGPARATRPTSTPTCTSAPTAGHLPRRQGRTGPGRDDLARRSWSPKNSTCRSTSVDIVMGDTDLCPWDMGTFGSLSIRQFGPVLRAAGRRGARRCCCRWRPSGCRRRSTALTVEGRRRDRRRGRRGEEGDATAS